jgi:hypothetical protein
MYCTLYQHILITQSIYITVLHFKMAARNDISKSIFEVTDEAGWNAVMQDSEEKLIGKETKHFLINIIADIVMDCHQDWCGKCESVFPTFQRLFLDHANCEKRMAIACVPLLAELKPKIQELIPTDAHINVEKMGCLPLFLMIRNKACVGVIQGVDTPGIVTQVGMNIPENKATEEEM